IAKGRIRAIDTDEALAAEGVLAVLWHENARKLHEQLDDGELMLFQSNRVAYRGQLVAVVIAESLEAAQEAERLLRVEYDVEDHDVELRADHPRLYKPEKVNPQFPTDTFDGVFDDAFAAAPVQVDRTYETPAYHNNPLEPHTTVASWQGDAVTLWDSNQGVQPVVETVAKAFGLEQDRVRVISQHVGGGFGSKGTPQPNVIAAIMASQLVGRPVKLAVTRQQMF